MAGKEFKTIVKGYHITFDSHVREWWAILWEAILQHEV